MIVAVQVPATGLGGALTVSAWFRDAELRPLPPAS